MIPNAKRRRSGNSHLPILVSKSTTIDDLPDCLLIEVLCRLPHNKFVFQCKLVSKHWLHVLSDSCIVDRFLRVQQEKLIENNGYVMLFSYKWLSPPRSEPDRRSFDANTLSNLIPRRPTYDNNTSNMSFVYIIRYFEDGEQEVIATYNDLVLCSVKLAKTFQTKYYICNIQTNGWCLRLPPTPTRVFKSDLALSVGFICDEPYYNLKYCDGPSSVVEINQEFRFRVVRLIPPDPKIDQQNNKVEYCVEIFSSETGEWREYSLLVSPPQSNSNIFCHAVACNGKLYWCTGDGFVFWFDLFNNINIRTTSIRCDNVIDPPPCPDIMEGSFTLRIGVCQGRLRMCKFSSVGGHIMIWELKPQNDQVQDGKPEWSLILEKYSIQFSYINDQLETISLPSDFNYLSNIKFLGFHPSDADILFIELFRQGTDGRLLWMFNVRKQQLSRQIGKPPVETSCCVGEIFPFVIPLWPTPIPHIQQLPAAASAASSSTPPLLTTAAMAWRNDEQQQVSNWNKSLHDADFTAHVLSVEAAENIVEKIFLFMLQSDRNICILSACGSISQLCIRRPGISSDTIVYEGSFEIVSLSGSYVLSDQGARSGWLNVCVGNTNGQIIAGQVAGPIIAFIPFQIIVGTYTGPEFEAGLPWMRGGASMPLWSQGKLSN